MGRRRTRSKLPFPRQTGTARRRPAGLEVIRDPQRAASLLHPVRRRILQALTEPDSAAGVARRLKLPRQVTNYHVREMVRAMLLAPAGRRKYRQFYAQCYIASARTYLLSPDVLGKLAADPKNAKDRFSAAYLMSLSALLQKELSRGVEATMWTGKRLATYSMNTELRFASPEQRAAFAGALERAVMDVVAKYSGPYRNADGSNAAGRAFRLVLGCYPIPGEPAAGGRPPLG